MAGEPEPKVTEKVTLRPQAGTVSVWRAAALRLGFESPKGPMAHEGNMSRLLSEMAVGTVNVWEVDAALRAARLELSGEPEPEPLALEEPPTPEPEPEPKAKRRRRNVKNVGK